MSACPACRASMPEQDGRPLCGACRASASVSVTITLPTGLLAMARRQADACGLSFGRWVAETCHVALVEARHAERHRHDAAAPILAGGAPPHLDPVAVPVEADEDADL